MSRPLFKCSIFLIFMLCFFFCQQAVGQERAGLAYGQYSGINAASLNPAYSLNYEHNWNLQLWGGHFFGETDYATITNSNFFSLLTASADDILVRTFRDEVVDRAYPMEVLFNEVGSTFIDIKAEALGPAFMMNLHNGLVVGVSTRGRALGASYGIPAQLNYYTSSIIEADETYQIEKAHGASAGFIELDLHASKRMSRYLNAGATLKLMRGYEAFWASNNIDFTFTEFNEDNVDFLSDGDFTISHSEPIEGTIEGKGFGLGMDLGVTLGGLWGKGTQLGVSLLDVGYIRYNGVSRDYGFNPDQVLIINAYTNLTTVPEVDSLLSVDFTVTDSSNHFIVQLPTALSIQYQQKLTNKISVAGHWTQRVNVFKNQIARSNSINVTGVYDSKHLSAFLPVTLYNYHSLRIGAAVRLGILTVGTDHLMSMFGESELSGADFYMNIQLYPFKKEKKNLFPKLSRKYRDGIECSHF